MDGVAAVDRIGVAEAHGDVVGEVGGEAAGVHRVDVGEQLGSVGHGRCVYKNDVRAKHDPRHPPPHVLRRRRAGGLRLPRAAARPAQREEDRPVRRRDPDLPPLLREPDRRPVDDPHELPLPPGGLDGPARDQPAPHDQRVGPGRRARLLGRPAARGRHRGRRGRAPRHPAPRLRPSLRHPVLVRGRDRGRRPPALGRRRRAARARDPRRLRHHHLGPRARADGRLPAPRLGAEHVQSDGPAPPVPDRHRRGRRAPARAGRGARAPAGHVVVRRGHDPPPRVRRASTPRTRRRPRTGSSASATPTSPTSRTAATSTRSTSARPAARCSSSPRRRRRASRSTSPRRSSAPTCASRRTGRTGAPRSRSSSRSTRSRRSSAEPAPRRPAGRGGAGDRPGAAGRGGRPRPRPGPGVHARAPRRAARRARRRLRAAAGGGRLVVPGALQRAARSPTSRGSARRSRPARA